jgi:hypothetical protein
MSATLIDCLRAMLGGNALTSEIPLLTAAEARAAKLPREHGVLYSDAVEEAIDEIADPGPCSRDATRAAYYLGLQVGWRVAQRLR